MNIEELKLKPFINRLGNKSIHIKHFIDYIPKEYNTYIEPFVGSGALFLDLKPKKWIINDINIEIIKSWLIILNDITYVLKYLKIIKDKYFNIKSINEKVLYLKKLTVKLNNLNKSTEKYILFLILNKLHYRGSLLMLNNRYLFYTINNISHDNPSIFKQIYFDLLKNINYYLNNTKGEVYNIDYKEILKKSKKNDFVFIDPPYVSLDKINYKYNFKETSINNNFLQELYNEVQKLDKKGVKWMMTQENSKEIKNIFKEYKIRKYKVYRTFLKKYVYELFIMNY